MQKAMSKLKKPLIVILVLLICYLLLFLFCKPIFYRLYLGHRIKGDISVTVNSEMDEEMRENIKNALLNIVKTEEGSEILKELFNMHGFVEATDEDYDVIRKTAETLDIDLEKMD